MTIYNTIYRHGKRIILDDVTWGNSAPDDILDILEGDESDR